MANGYLIEQCRYRTFPALHKVLLDNAALEIAENILMGNENLKNREEEIGTVL